MHLPNTCYHNRADKDDQNHHPSHVYTGKFLSADGSLPCHSYVLVFLGHFWAWPEVLLLTMYMCVYYDGVFVCLLIHDSLLLQNNTSKST